MCELVEIMFKRLMMVDMQCSKIVICGAFIDAKVMLVVSLLTPNAAIPLLLLLLLLLKDSIILGKDYDFYALIYRDKIENFFYCYLTF
jgi:hypothetical protein